MQLLAGLEAHGFAWRDVDFFTGARVAADAGLAGLDAEDAEAAQFNALPAAQGTLQGLEDSFALVRLIFGDVAFTTAFTMSNLITLPSALSVGRCYWVHRRLSRRDG